MDNNITTTNNAEHTGEANDDQSLKPGNEVIETFYHNPNFKNNNSYYPNSSQYFSNRNYSRKYEENYSNYNQSKEYINNNQYSHNTNHPTHPKHYNYNYNHHHNYMHHASAHTHSANYNSHIHRVNASSYYNRNKKNSLMTQNLNNVGNNENSTSNINNIINANYTNSNDRTLKPDSNSFKKKKRSLNTKSPMNVLIDNSSPSNNINNINVSNNVNNVYNNIQLTNNNPISNLNMMNNFNNFNLHIRAKNSSAIKKLIFIKSYDKCSDFSNYKNFLNLNLKFLKQNYKFKENIDQDENNNLIGMNNINNYQNNKNNMQSLMYMQLNNRNNSMLNNMSNIPTPSQNINTVDNEINQGMYFYSPYISLNKASDQYINFNSNDENNNMYYESFRLQPYTFVRDPKMIDENLKSGRYLKGVIRINKCHTHGYITVPGLVNDILIRGNRNLNQSLHMDEVIVELFPMVCWKPLFNKKIRKMSLAQKSENYEHNASQNPISSKDAQNELNENYYTDAEKDEDMDIDGKEDNYENIKLKNEDIKIMNYNSDGNIASHNANNEDNELNSMKFKENFEDIEERLKYINKIYNLRPEGRIVKIHHSPNYEKAQIVRIVNEKSLIFACPINENLPKIFIKMKKFRRIEFIRRLESDFSFKNKYFLVRIVGWALNFKCPKGIIVNELGNSGDIDVETEVLLRTYEIDYNSEYTQQAMQELKQFENWNVNDHATILKERIDLRKELIFTIDPKHSKDLDDAISVKLINEETGLLEVGVHIADPSHFVLKDSLLDKEAMNRVTTVYLVHKNIPMLPRIFSEDICSLLPFKDRLAFSCVFRIYYNGALDTNFSPQFFLSIINSSAKWNYELVQKIINGEEVKYDQLSDDDGTKPKTEEIFMNMCDKIKMLHKLTKLVRSQRIESGSLIIENEEVAFDINEESNYPVGFRIKNKSDSNHLIEELMLIANKLTAELLYEHIKDFALIRKHPFLNDNKFLEIQRYLSMNKLIVDFEDPQALNDMLFKIKKQNQNKYLCIQRKLKNFMQRAEYVISGYQEYEDLRHSALNFDLYTHFTSPIRRYPDMIVHRQLKYVLKKIKTGVLDLNEFSGFERFIDIFNEKYINGKMISSRCQKVFHCILLKNMPTLIYKALVVDINYKSNSKNKRNSIQNMTGMETGPSLSVCIFIPSLNLEMDWKKEDNPNILNYRVSNTDNSLILDYKCDDQTVSNKTIKTFDEINVIVSCVDSIPIDLKCSFVLK